MDLNLRGVDDALVERLKRGAFDRGKTLKAYCIEALEGVAVCDSEARQPAKVPKKIVEPDPLAVALELAASGAEEPEKPKPTTKIVETESPEVYRRPAHAANCRCFQCKPPK